MGQQCPASPTLFELEWTNERIRKRRRVERQAHAEAMADRIADIIHDAGSSDGTLAGIADHDMRAEAEKQIARERRDSARTMRQRAEYLAAWRAEQNAKQAA